MIYTHLNERRYTIAYLLIFSFLFFLYKSAIFSVITVERMVTIDPSKVTHYNGYLYVAQIEHDISPFFEVIDERLDSAADNLRLSENGRSLGPAHTPHNEISQKGGGRFSHWKGQVVFSSSDGSDPRTNGRTYVASVTAQIAEHWGYIALVCIWIAGLMFSKRLESWIGAVSVLIQRNTPALVNMALFLALGTLAVFATGFLGSIGKGAIKPPGLGIAIIWHGLIGFIIALFPFFLGGGLLGFLHKTVSLSIAVRILAGFPLGLPLAFWIAASLISMKYGWVLAVIVLLTAASGWFIAPPSRQQLGRYLKLAAMVFPFGLLLAGWGTLYWHGPYHGSDGHSSGDMTYYTTGLQLLSTYGLPLPQFGLEGERVGVAAYFTNQLFIILGAAVSKAIPVDPSLFLISSTFISYVVGISLVVVAFKDDLSPEGISMPVLILLALVILSAGRYPFWIVESPSVSHALVLAVCVLWLALKSEKNTIVSGASLAAAIVGSALSKIVAFGVLVPLSLAPSISLIARASLRVRIVFLILLAIGGIYCLGMLAKYLPLFLSIGRFGPETFLYVITDGLPLQRGIVFVLRDLSVVLLLTAWFRMFKLPMAIALSVGALSFLLNAFLFQINHGVVLLATAMLVIANPASLLVAPISTFLGVALALPAFLSADYTGSSAATVWLVSMTGTICCACVLLKPENKGSFFKKISLQLSMAAVIAIFLFAIAVERGLLRVESSSNNIIPASAADIWQQVKIRTEKDILVFTDQTSPTNWDMLGGWNNFALTGERQVYVANWMQTSLRGDSSRREQVFATNDAVLSGALSPDKVPTSHIYGGFAAVVSSQRHMKELWQLVYKNKDWALYQWSHNE